MTLRLSPYDYGKDALYEKDTRALMEKISCLGSSPSKGDLEPLVGLLLLSLVLTFHFWL